MRETYRVKGEQGMIIYVLVICMFSFVFVFTSIAVLQYMSVCHVGSAGAVFVSYGADWLCFHPQRVFPDGAMETRRTGGDARARINWQLNRRLLTSLTGHKRANVECVCARTCACLCMCDFVREKPRKKNKNAQTERKRVAWKPNYLSRALSACSESRLQRVSRLLTNLLAPRAATATCPCKGLLSSEPVCVWAWKGRTRRGGALAQTQVQVKVICLTHTHAPAQTNEGTGEQPKCFDTLSCAEVNGVVVRLRQRVWPRVFLPNPFILRLQAVFFPRSNTSPGESFSSVSQKVHFF